MGATATDVQVNYDGWPQKWDSVSRNTASIETETRLFFRKPNYSVFTAGIQEEIVQDRPVQVVLSRLQRPDEGGYPSTDGRSQRRRGPIGKSSALARQMVAILSRLNFL